jgi:hypothetical protein
MAESTAGIGEAGALVNRAKAPATMDITRGIQMAESSALKKAQLEASKAAKAQAKAASIAKMSRVDTGKFKNLGVAKEAKERALDLSTRKALALESGDYVSDAKLDIEADYLGNYLASKDNAISTLKSPKKYDYAKKAGELINAGKEEEAAKYNKPYAPVFVKGEMGDYIVEVPDAADLNKVYSSVLKNAFRDEISFASLKDAATDTDNYSIKRRMTPTEVAMNTGNLLRDQGYVKSVLYDPDFQKFYDAKFGGSGDPASVEAGLYDYTQERINNINKDKVSIKGKSKGGDSNVYSTDYGFKWGKYDIQVNDIPAQKVLDQTYNLKDGENYVVEGASEGANNALRKQMSDIVSQNPNATWKRIPLVDLGKLTFVNPETKKEITDADLVAIYSSGKKHWIQYRYKDFGGLDMVGVSPINQDILTVLNGKMGSGKQGATLRQVVDAFKKEGIDFSSIVGKTLNVGGSTPPPVKASGGTKKERTYKGIDKDGNPIYG